MPAHTSMMAAPKTSVITSGNTWRKRIRRVSRPRQPMSAVRGIPHQALERHDVTLCFGVEFQRGGAECDACHGERGREPEQRDTPPERAWKCSREPAPQIELSLLLPGRMDFAVGTRDDAFQVTAKLRLAGKCRDLRQVRGTSLVQLMEDQHVAQRKLPVRVALRLMKHPLQLVPMRLLLDDEPLEVDDHRSCLCLMSAYSEASWTPALPGSSITNRTPRCSNIFPSSRSLFHRRGPSRTRYTSTALSGAWPTS